jgi:hypothetical protein
MDYAGQQALTACGTCGQPESAHQAPVGENEQLAVLAALGGPCTNFTVSEAALSYQKHLAMANSGTGRKQPPRCGRCGNRGHTKERCPL